MKSNRTENKLFKLFLSIVLSLLLIPKFSLSEEEVANKSKSEIIEAIERGNYLIKIAQCGSCHGKNPKDLNSPLSGGFIVKDSYGEVITPNITSHTMKLWSDDEIVRAIRSSIGHDENKLSIEVHKGYRWMSNYDANSIAKSLKATNSVPTETDESARRKISGKKWGMISIHSEVVGYVPQLPESTSGYYGLYLVNNILTCGRCHSPSDELFDDPDFLSGNKKYDKFSLSGQLVKAPNIRSSNDETLEGGILNWKLGGIKNFLATGKRPDNSEVSKECPTAYFSNLNERDREAVSAYLVSLN